MFIAEPSHRFSRGLDSPPLTWNVVVSFSLQESYVELEKAFRSLANFYSKAGPSAPLPEDVKSEILGELNAAEEYL